MVPPSNRPPSSSTAVAAEGYRTAFGVLDADGILVAVDPAWHDCRQPDAPFGAKFPVGERYADLCEPWSAPAGPEMAEAIRDVLSGVRDEARVEYDYVDGDAKRHAEMRVSRFDLHGHARVLVLHLDLQADYDQLLRQFQAARGDVEEQTDSLARHARELIDAREKAVEALRLKADCMANLGHEIRTPMNGIIGMTELALDTELTGQQREYLTSVHSAAHALLTLLNNILDFSGMESGQVLLAEVPFDPRDLLAQTLAPLAERAHEKGLGLKYEVDPEIPDLLVGDPERVGQVLHNLVDNGIKFTERGEVHVRAVLEGIDDRKASIRFDVVDTGVGVDASQHRQIFECFVQADSSSTRRFGGAGLGLTIANHLAVAMGGRLHLESRGGMGSTFSFAIALPLGQSLRQHLSPRRSEPSHAQPASARSKPEGVSSTLAAPRPIRVLVAEDNPVSQSMLRSALERSGHHVELAENGKEAVQRVAADPFDLVFMDVEMPVLDGFGATALIREEEKQTKVHTPIVAMTDQTMLPDRERFRRAGMDEVLPKPIDTESLEALVQRLVAPRRGAVSSEGEAGEAPSAGLAFVDGPKLYAHAGGVPEIVTERIAAFMAERATLLEPIVLAIEQCDARELERAAQKLSGTFGTLAAPRATEAARRLGLIARIGNLDGAETALNLLRHEVSRLETELESIVQRAR